MLLHYNIIDSIFIKNTKLKPVLYSILILTKIKKKIKQKKITQLSCVYQKNIIIAKNLNLINV